MNNVSENFYAVSAEVLEAYCDCNDLKAGNAVYDRRSLNFMASHPVSRDEAKTILEAAIPDGYNEFNAELLNKFGKDSIVKIAREGSVCLYVKGGKMPSPKSVSVDEKSKEGEWVRFWWD